ncbi:transcription initiation factor TFIID subunit 4 isoform X2 [Alosa sapidissima]|uniref:transcription initiation factor TFIID subunit 4 isoform X2 n=1 Tax=Alosa sapidissima TaxID=34773 RepID=UPI001C088C8F|nr:transcription initiation factor TFIID subunit 4 isoform X2 [Alosa sapidissima]
MSANSSSECSQTQQTSENACQTSADAGAGETSTIEGSDVAQLASTDRQASPHNAADDARLGSHDPKPSIISNDKAVSNSPASHRPSPPSTATGGGGGTVGQTNVSPIQVCPTSSVASPRISVPKAQTTPTQPTMVKTVAPTPPRTPALKTSVAMVRPPQTASVQLPATFQIPPGMVLVRSDSGQLMLVSQQALAQAQRVVNNPGLVQPSAATVIRKPGSAPIIRVCPPVSTPRATYTMGTIPPRPSSTTGPTLQRPNAVGRVAYRPTTAVGTITQRPSSTMGTNTQRPSSAVGTIPQRASSAVGTVPQRLSSVVGATRQHITSTTGATIIKASVAGLSTTPAVGQSSHPGGLAPRILSTNVPTKPKTAPSNAVSSQTIENVKKCKNFLVTLMKLASSGGHSSDMGMNVRNLVKSLLDGKLEAEEFTEKLYAELKSSPQPYLVTFLKRSLPAVRQLTPNSQLFIQQCEQPSAPAAPPAQPSTSGQPVRSTQLLIQPQQTVVIKKPVTSQPAAQGGGVAKHFLLQTNRTPTTGVIVGPSAQISKSHPASSLPTLNLSFKESTGTFRDEDDINDVASMAGVSISEERARILATGAESVGLVVRSCRDQPFLCPTALRTRITHTGSVCVCVCVCETMSVGVCGLEGDVVGLVSHATEERLRDLLGKLSVTAQHRHLQLKDCWQYQQVTDVRSQLRFLEQVERLQQQRRDEEEREMLLRIAKSRSSREDPEQQCLKQKAKEMQQLELAQAQHRQANLAALAAIGPRRKRPLEVSSAVGQRSTSRPVLRVTLRDLIFCMEQDSHLSHSLLLYSAMLK